MGHYDSDSAEEPSKQHRVMPSSKEVKKAIAKAQGKSAPAPAPAPKKKVKTMSKERRKKVEKRQVKKDAEAEREGLLKELSAFTLSQQEKKKMNKV